MVRLETFLQCFEEVEDKLEEESRGYFFKKFVKRRDVKS
jgi:hypothetical protein